MINTDAKRWRFEIINFYKFKAFPLPILEEFKKELLKKGQEKNIRGLILLSKEGINASVSGEATYIKEYLQEIEQLTDIHNIFYKKTLSNTRGFKQLRVKIKKEILTSKKPEPIPDFSDQSLKPKEWEKMLSENPITLLDIRNDYEIDVGQFKGAKDLQLKEFSQFPDKLKRSDCPKKQKTLIYCTGGIRCEKALLEMKKQGFEEVYQLKGGILNYLKEFSHKSYEGECFVFDRRVAVNQNNEASKRYTLCPQCGQAGDQKINCAYCNQETKICKKCLAKDTKHLMTCTKNCAYHHKMGHRYKRSHKKKDAMLENEK